MKELHAAAPPSEDALRVSAARPVNEAEGQGILIPSFAPGNQSRRSHQQAQEEPNNGDFIVG